MTEGFDWISRTDSDRALFQSDSKYSFTLVLYDFLLVFMTCLLDSTMGRPSKRFALFLCLIVVHHDFIQARSSYYSGQQWVSSTSSKYRQRRSSFGKVIILKSFAL